MDLIVRFGLAPRLGGFDDQLLLLLFAEHDEAFVRLLENSEQGFERLVQNLIESQRAREDFGDFQNRLELHLRLYAQSQVGRRTAGVERADD